LAFRKRENAGKGGENGIRRGGNGL